MGKKPAQIYPLPISHENQCTTLGVASNPDLFQQEFGFKSAHISNYLPLRHSGEGFDLEQSYKRFAFLRKLDIHKKEHANYECILRGTAQSDEASL